MDISGEMLVFPRGEDLLELDNLSARLAELKDLKPPPDNSLIKQS